MPTPFGNKILARVGMHNMYECVICPSNINLSMCIDKTTFEIINDTYVPWKVFIQIEKTIMHIWAFAMCHFEIERTSASNLWLEKMLDIFVTIENECDLYQVEMLEFVERMKHACAHKNINKMWAQCNSTLEWWPIG